MLSSSSPASPHWRWSWTFVRTPRVCTTGAGQQDKRCRRFLHLQQRWHAAQRNLRRAPRRRWRGAPRLLLNYCCPRVACTLAFLAMCKRCTLAFLAMCKRLEGSNSLWVPPHCKSRLVSRLVSACCIIASFLTCSTCWLRLRLHRQSSRTRTSITHASRRQRRTSLCERVGHCAQAPLCAHLSHIYRHHHPMLSPSH